MVNEFYGDIDLNASGKISGLLAGTADTDAATVGQMNALAEGTNWKDNVRLAAPANVNLAAPGATIDGVTMAVNNRFLAPNQTAGEQNGIYIFNGAATPATRSSDANSFAELINAVVIVDEGTTPGAGYRQTVVSGTLGVTPLVFVAAFSSAPAASTSTAGIARYATQGEVDAGVLAAATVTPQTLGATKLFVLQKSFIIGDASATIFNCDHNLNTRLVMVQAIRNSGNYETVGVEVTRPALNRTTITFPASYVPALNEFIILIQGKPA